MTAGTLVAERSVEVGVGSRCRWCSSPLVSTGGRGRPAAYCGATCRRAAEFRVRSLRNAHGRLEMTVRVEGGVENRLRLRELECEIVRLGSQVRFVFLHRP
jgi:hypothetical protein